MKDSGNTIRCAPFFAAVLMVFKHLAVVPAAERN
jgi:hypothetical protein